MKNHESRGQFRGGTRARTRPPKFRTLCDALGADLVGRQRATSADEMTPIRMASNARESLLGFQERAPHPALDHLPAAPPLQVARVALDPAVQVLDIRRSQRPLQRPRQSETQHRTRLVQSFPDRRPMDGGLPLVSTPVRPRTPIRSRHPLHIGSTSTPAGTSQQTRTWLTVMRRWPRQTHNNHCSFGAFG